MVLASDHQDVAIPGQRARPLPAVHQEGAGVEGLTLSIEWFHCFSHMVLGAFMSWGS